MEALARVDGSIRAQSLASVIIEEIVVIAAGTRDQSPNVRVTPTAAEQLGVARLHFL